MWWRLFQASIIGAVMLALRDRLPPPSIAPAFLGVVAAFIATKLLSAALDLRKALQRRRYR